MIAIEVEGGKKERKSCQSTSVKATCYASAGRRGDRSGGEGGARSSGPCRTGEEEGGGWGGKKGGGGRGGELLCMYAWKEEGGPLAKKGGKEKKGGKISLAANGWRRKSAGEVVEKAGLRKIKGKNMIRHTHLCIP